MSRATWIVIGVLFTFGSTLHYGRIWTLPPVLFGLGAGILCRTIFVDGSE